MQLSSLILLGCLAMTCLAFPARDFTIPTDPDRDDVLVPQRQLPEEEDYRRRRYAQMNPGQSQPAESEQPSTPTEGQTPVHPISEHPVPEEMKPEETRRRRSAQMELVPRIRQPLEKDVSDDHLPATQQPPTEKPKEARRRRNAQAEMMPILAAQQQQNEQIANEQSSIGEDDESADQMSEETRRRRNAQMEMEPRIREPLEGDASKAPFTPRPPAGKKSSEGRHRRYAQVETSEGASQKKDLSMPQPSESTTEQSPSEKSGAEGQSPESTTEEPLDEEGGMKPVDARRRRSAQLELEPILMMTHQHQDSIVSTTDQSSIAKDKVSADQMTQGARRRRHGHGQRGQSSSQEQQLATTQPSSQLSEQARRRRQLEPGFDTLSILTTEQPMTEGKASETTTKAASTDSSEEQTSESADIGLGTNQQFAMTEKQQPMNGKQNSGSSSESSEEQPAPEEIVPVETRKRRHAQLAMAPEMNLQTELPTRQAASSIDGKSSESSESAESSEKIVPETRRRRHMPIRQGTGEQAGSTTEQSSSEESESRESQQNLPQGNRQRRRAEDDLGVQVAGITTDQIPTGEPEGEGSAHIRMLPPDMQQNEDKTTEHTEVKTTELTKESTTEEDETKTETREADNSDGFWQRKARLWEHLW